MKKDENYSANNHLDEFFFEALLEVFIATQ